MLHDDTLHDRDLPDGATSPTGAPILLKACLLFASRLELAQLFLGVCELVACPINCNGELQRTRSRQRSIQYA